MAGLKTLMADVILVLLRGAGPEPRVPPAPRPARLLVVDAAAELVEHAAWYAARLREPGTEGIVCIAIGANSGALPLRPPELDGPRCAVLWVEDEREVLWDPQSNGPRTPEPAAGGVDVLVDALSEREVFDAALTAVGALSDRTGVPGVRMAVGSLSAAEVESAVAAESAEFAAPALGRPIEPALFDALDQLARGADPAPPPRADSRVERAKELAYRAVDELSALVRAGSGVAAQLQVVVDAVAAHRHEAGRLLARIDGNLRLGEPPTSEVLAGGAPLPASAGTVDVPREVHRVVERWLGRGSLPELIDELRQIAGKVEPHGCPVEADRLQRPVPAGVERPAASFIGRGLITTVIVTCAAVAFTVPGAVGPALAGVWVVLCLHVRHRRALERPTAVATAAVVGVSGLLGVAAGAVADELVPGPVHGVVGVVVVVLAVVVAALLAVRIDARAVGIMQNGAGLPARRAAVARADAELAAVIRDQWWPSQRRRTVGRALRATADALDEAVDVLRRRGETGPATAGGPAELRTVVRADLLGAIRAGLRAGPPGRQGSVLRSLAAYDAHLARADILVPPPAASDEDARQRLAAMVWASGAAALAGEERWVADLADSGGVLIRFAPERARSVLAHVLDPPEGVVVWTAGGDRAGSIRLLPSPGATGAAEAEDQQR